MMKHIGKLTLLVISYWLLINLTAYAEVKDITIIYTGETHAMLYPCNCPREPDGGIARRAALVKELKKADPHTLLLDSGGFFAGGLMDEYTQNIELDMRRNEINLKAMRLMGYDAVAVGDDEFYFGREYLEKNASVDRPAFLSANLKSDKVLKYIIKEFSGTKIGIVGLTPLFALSKAGGLEITEPKAALEQVVEELKKKNTDIIIVLSHLGESEDLNLINETKGIDILIVGHNRTKEEPSTRIGSTLVLRPSWQGRHLVKLTLKIDKNKISDYKIEDRRLSGEIKDDPEMLSILPVCFSDANCKKEGLGGTCRNPGKAEAACSFGPVNKIDLSVIVPKMCVACDTSKVTAFLKNVFPGIKTSYLYYPSKNADKLIKELKLDTLPAYLLEKAAEKEKSFGSIKENVGLKGDFYILKPQLSGIAYFLNRERLKDRFDLFISLYAKESQKLLDTVKDFKPRIHFLVNEQETGVFNAGAGGAEVEECLRSVCINKYYPQHFWNYISCRAKNINSSWWQDCIFEADLAKIKSCAQANEGRALLRENISLNKELTINNGPAYLFDNRNIFGSWDSPKKEEFKKIIDTVKKQ